MDPRLRMKKPKKVAKWPSFLDWTKKGRQGRQKKITDPLIPEPKEPITISRVKTGHLSEKVHQDDIERIMLKNIKEATPGSKRHEYLELDYYAWVQKGRPVLMAAD